MEEPFDTQALMERASLVVKEIRKSEAYPAIIGGIAGGIAGALIAALIAGGRSRRSDVDTAAARASSRPAWSLRDAAQLLTVVAALAKQAQTWYKEQRR